MKKVFMLVLFLACSSLLMAQTKLETPRNEFKYDLNVRTNLLYWAGGMMNAGVELLPEDTRLGVVLNGGYSPFGEASWEHNFGGWFIAPEVRYYLGEKEQWFAGVQLLACGYNYKMDYTGYMGSMLSAGVMGGYKMHLCERLYMDFTLGLGYSSFKYDTYYHASNGTNPCIDRNLKKHTITPIQAGVNLIWKIK